MKLERTNSQLGNVVSLFSGAGGMDIGFYRAGFVISWANDIDGDAVKTYNNLFKTNHATSGDLLNQKLPTVENLDLVIGGPPCQGFSVAGKMDPKDPRSKHVWNFLGVVNDLQPKAFVMENVKALAVNSRWQGLLNDLREKADKIGYKTKLLVLNASHFNVPQARERMFLIGNREDRFILPSAVTKDNPPTVRQALAALPSHGKKGNSSICTAKITPARKPILRKSPYAGMIFNGQGRPLNMDAPALTLPASMGGNRTPIIDQNELETFGAPWVVDYHKRLLDGKGALQKAPDFLRRITVEEAAAIQTFPLGMTFFGSQTSRYRQIGNAVPPMLAYHVALAMKQTLYGHNNTQSVHTAELSNSLVA